MNNRFHIISLYRLLALVLVLVPRQISAQSAVVSVRVDATKKGSPLKHVWQYYGYDECNYTTAANCIALMKTVAEINPEPVYLRQHFLLNSGDGRASLKWGSTNLYTENENGEPVYDWWVMDKIMDAITASGCRPLIEIGFMPKDLSSRPNPYENSDTYRLDGGCFYPPKDYDKWAKLIRRWVLHSAARYRNVEKLWLWELWNEPNIDYWHGTFEEFCKLFDYTEKAIHDALPSAVLGGPHTAGAPGFLRDFLQHCASGTNYATGEKGTRLDYIGFHAKGGVSLRNGNVRMNLGNQLRIHRRGFGIVADFPEYWNTPIIIGEADPDGCAACPSSRFPERGYRNVPAYGAYVAAMMKYTLDLAEQQNVNLKGVLTWAFMFDDMPYFEGYRTLATNGIHKPVLNAFKMLGQMKGNELPLTSDGAVGLDEILRRNVRTRPDINGMAVADDRRVKILLWNYHDLLVPAKPASIQLTVKLPEDFVSKAETVRVVHYRVDVTHSNAYTKWLELGSPQNPGPEMLAKLKAAMELQMLEPAKVIDITNSEARLDFDLPRFGLSLIILEKLNNLNIL